MADPLHTRPFHDFIEFALPLYSGPQVTIRIAPKGCEYKLSKALLCKHSPVFQATFEGGFREGHEQEITLNEEDGVVSVRGFELLTQWMYLGRVIFGDLSPTESISAAIEFSRIADMYGVTGMEAEVAAHLKTLIKNSSPDCDYKFDSNTYHIDSEHIAWAVHLPQGHPVRKILAAASVREYLEDPEQKFTKEAKEIVGFAFDLLEAVKDAFTTLRRTNHGVFLFDPISNRKITLPSQRE